MAPRRHTKLSIMHSLRGERVFDVRLGTMGATRRPAWLAPRKRILIIISRGNGRIIFAVWCARLLFCTRTVCTRVAEHACIGIATRARRDMFIGGELMKNVYRRVRQGTSE